MHYLLYCTVLCCVVLYSIVLCMFTHLVHPGVGYADGTEKWRTGPSRLHCTKERTQSSRALQICFCFSKVWISKGSPQSHMIQIGMVVAVKAVQIQKKVGQNWTVFTNGSFYLNHPFFFKGEVSDNSDSDDRARKSGSSSCNSSSESENKCFIGNIMGDDNDQACLYSSPGVLSSLQSIVESPQSMMNAFDENFFSVFH